MKLQNSLSLLCILLLISCGDQIKNQSFQSSGNSPFILTEQPNLTIKISEQKWQTGNCEAEGKPCFEITVNYPQFQGSNDEILKRVNRSIQEQVLQSISDYNFSEDDENKQQDLDQIVEAIFLDFNQTFQDATMQVANHWTIELTGEQISETENTITVVLSEYSYMGGAHPNSYQTYLNFNKKTGDIIQLKDLITEEETVLEVAEKRFREVYDVAPNRPLTEAGLFENQLTLPENFAITQEGLLFFYNTYEIAPYAAGRYQFTIPRQQLPVTK
ncbi:hypothetical protein PCC7418_0216 [Halothece sp. PCC 7418]|uniref:DUF3298 and DUF4163 domain-containing protein n=1 Tax=Halothece sp. (strain PCC 7418) TaxID=65093 RepID=UPI0002A08A20|nr:DUF3298 and DUF4163 domain-containing protein [Halothece sp. PCC 7418]AFZ42453.1 hypothetical protein PCC7418_0216 [Halothece sp. PCC 7418]